MIEIVLFWPEPQSRKIEVQVPVLPQRGDLFELEKGNRYEVAQIVFCPDDDQVCSVYVELKAVE